MGTSAACMGATIHYSVHEKGRLFPDFASHLPLFMFKIFIDEMFSVWVNNNDPQARNEFKAVVNDFGILMWEFEDPSDTVNFLDLTISIKQGRILVTKTR